MRTALFFFVFGLAAARSQQQFADIGDLRLENGQTIPHCRIVSDDIGRANGGSMARAAARVTAKALVVVRTQDHMVNPLPALESAPKIHARVVDLTGNCGHMATSCEAGKLASAVKHSWRSEHPGRAVRHPMFPWNPNI